MLRRTGTVLGAVAAAMAAWMGFVVVAMRTRSPRLLAVVRRFNRGFTNRLVLRSAGGAGAYASVIRHRGRRSGRTYETPVVPFTVDGGFLISLPYGPETDWVRNVLAAGSAQLVTGGEVHAVGRPEVLAVDAVGDRFPPGERRNHRVFGVTHCLYLRLVRDGSAEPDRVTRDGTSVSA